MDFKGPLPSKTKNRYLLTIIDEYSRFPFAFPCSNFESKTVIKCLTELFAIFGTPGYIHSDNGPSLISEELKSFLLAHGIATSNSAVYNPQGNGQCERYNGIIWRTIELSLHTKGLETAYWEEVLQESLHCIRTLLCTSTNETPHERLFSFQRQSATGSSLPSWLLNKGSVLLRRHVKHSKYEPRCDEVQIIDINPSHARIRHPAGLEQVVSLRDLAPLPDKIEHISENNVSPAKCDFVPDTGNKHHIEVTENNPSGSTIVVEAPMKAPHHHGADSVSDSTPQPAAVLPQPEPTPLRRSVRETKPIERFQAG